jgi:hypothetical protein
MRGTRGFVDAFLASDPDASARCHIQLDSFCDKSGEFRRDDAMWSTYLRGQHRLSQGLFRGGAASH